MTEGPPWGSPLALRKVREQKRKLKLHKQEATRLAGEEGCGGAVAMASVYQTQAWGRVGAPGRNIHSAQKWSGGAQPGQRQGRGSRSGILGKGHFTGTDTCKGFLREATVEGMEACGEGKLQVLG